MRAANLGLRFLLELGALAALGWWGWTVHPALGLVLPVVTAVVWGLFVSPKARYPVSRVAWYAIQVVIFGAAALALGAVWSVVAGIVFALAVAANLVVLAVVDR
jgi:uncharacterized protein DUF2568